MTPAEAAEAMQKLLAANYADPEATHIAADLLLCEVLASLGYGEMADVFLAMERYYA